LFAISIPAIVAFNILALVIASVAISRLEIVASSILLPVIVLFAISKDVIVESFIFAQLSLHKFVMVDQFSSHETYSNNAPIDPFVAQYAVDTDNIDIHIRNPILYFFKFSIFFIILY
jgi:hypothetical protein